MPQIRTFEHDCTVICTDHHSHHLSTVAFLNIEPLASELCGRNTRKSRVGLFKYSHTSTEWLLQRDQPSAVLGMLKSKHCVQLAGVSLMSIDAPFVRSFDLTTHTLPGHSQPRHILSCFLCGQELYADCFMKEGDLHGLWQSEQCNVCAQLVL
jgi:hypothetical protein